MFFFYSPHVDNTRDGPSRKATLVTGLLCVDGFLNDKVILFKFEYGPRSDKRDFMAIKVKSVIFTQKKD